MTAGLVTLVTGVAVGAAALGGPAAAQVPRTQPEACAGAEAWETDAQALADALEGASGSGVQALLQELEAAGFVPGGRPGAAAEEPAASPSASDPGGGLPDALVELLLSLAAALDGDGDGEIPVTVIDPSGDADAAAPRTDSGSGGVPGCSDPPRSDPGPRSDPTPQPDSTPQPDPDGARPDGDETGAEQPSTRSTEDEPGEEGE